MSTLLNSACRADFDTPDDDEAEPSFGEVLRTYRRAAHLTQEELAERASLSVRSISGWERGEGATPRRDTTSLLVRALDLSGPDRAAFEALVARSRIRGRMQSQSRPPSQSRLEPQRAFAADPPASAPRHNLGRSVSSFVGRERDLAELGPLVRTSPLVTLVGPGGAGKTRLAQEMLRREAEQFTDGGWLVELAELTTPDLLAAAVAAAVGLQEGSARSVMQVLNEYLRSRHLLLVLDNCEHMVKACAEFVAQLVRECPRLHVFATSREPLAIHGEIIWLVRPLDVPDLEARFTADQLLQSPAARLFVERATAVDPRFSVTDANAAILARICVALDGLPLAVELAAPLTRLLSLEEISERLGCEADFLRNSSRDGTPRHRTIRATIDWSHDLLDEREQMLLRRLAIFAGGWSLDMAEQVCGSRGIEASDVLSVLGQLIDKSMVVVDANRSTARYRMLEPIRQYAMERLLAAGEVDEFSARHSALLLSMPAAGENGDDFGVQEIASLDRFETEHANVRAALRWALDHGKTEAALRAAARLFRFWERRGHLREGCSWLEEGLAQGADAPSVVRGEALNALAFLYWRVGELDDAERIAQRGLRVNRGHDNPLGLAFALGNVGVVAYLRSDAETAVRWLEESVAIARRTGYRPLLSVALTFLGRALLALHGPYDVRAAGVLQESLSMAEAAQARYAIGHALVALGDLDWRRGQEYSAMALWHRALEVQSQLADRRGIVASTERIAWSLVATGQFDAAVWLFGAAHAQRRLLGIALGREQQRDHDELLAQARQQLEDDFEPAWLTGEASIVDEAVTLALEASVTQELSGMAS